MSSLGWNALVTHACKGSAPTSKSQQLANDHAAWCSQETRHIFRDFDPDMDAGSLDEAYLDVTDYCRAHDMTGTGSWMTSRAHGQGGCLVVTIDICNYKHVQRICSAVTVRLVTQVLPSYLPGPPLKPGRCRHVPDPRRVRRRGDHPEASPGGDRAHMQRRGGTQQGACKGGQQMPQQDHDELPQCALHGPLRIATFSLDF